MQYYSQYQQDKFLNEVIFKNKKNGIFVDIGAHDGISLSNSYFFEKELNWNGICIEPIDFYFNKLEKNRNCIKIKGCAWTEDTVKTFRLITGYSEMLSGIVDCYDPRHLKRIDSECELKDSKYEDVDVVCHNINRLLSEHKLNYIDFLSIDTEGSELEILKSINYDTFDIKVIVAENNYQDNSLVDFLNEKNYKFHGKLSCDYVFLKNDFIY